MTVPLVVALRPDAATTDRLIAIGERLASWGLPGQWTLPDDWHLPLVHCPAVDAEEADWLPSVLAPLAEALAAPAGMRLAGLLAVGGSTQPRSVAVAIADPDAQCAAVQRDACAMLDQDPDRDFRPSFDLCRPRPGRLPVDLPAGRDWPHLLAGHGLAAWGPCVCDRFEILRVREAGLVPRLAMVAGWVLPPG